MPGTMSTVAPAMREPRSCPAATGTKGSAWPWITQVGDWMRATSAERSPSATTAASWRAVPAGRQARFTLSSKR